MSDHAWAPPPLRPYRPMIINVALTGAVPTKADNPNVPVTPQEIARDAIDCARAGASMVHIHVRDGSQRPTHDRELYARSVELIRREIPELIITVTTTGRVDPDDVAARSVGLDLDPPPDMASLTLGSFNFPSTISHNPFPVVEGLLARMRARGVKPELEVFEPGMVNTAHVLRERGVLVDDRPYFNVLLGSLGSAPADVGTLSHIVDRLPPDAEWAAAGIGAFQRQMVLAATVMGGNVRTGLEDAPSPVRGRHPTNREAVEFAVQAAAMIDRDIATPAEARARLGLAPGR